MARTRRYGGRRTWTDDDWQRWRGLKRRRANIERAAADALAAAYVSAALVALVAFS